MHAECKMNVKLWDFSQNVFQNLFSKRATGEWGMLILFQSPISKNIPNQEQQPSKIPRKSDGYYSLQGPAVSVPIFKKFHQKRHELLTFFLFFFFFCLELPVPFTAIHPFTAKIENMFCDIVKTRITLTLLPNEIPWTQHNNTQRHNNSAHDSIVQRISMQSKWNYTMIHGL